MKHVGLLVRKLLEADEDIRKLERNFNPDDEDSFTRLQNARRRMGHSPALPETYIKHLAAQVKREAHLVDGREERLRDEDEGIYDIISHTWHYQSGKYKEYAVEGFIETGKTRPSWASENDPPSESYPNAGLLVKMMGYHGWAFAKITVGQHSGEKPAYDSAKYAHVHLAAYNYPEDKHFEYHVNRGYEPVYRENFTHSPFHNGHDLLEHLYQLVKKYSEHPRSGG